MRSFALETFVKYMGTGLMLIWFLLALLYLFVYEKRKPRRILFVYAPLVTLLLFFNPLFSRLLGALMGEEVYFRTCWILPVIMEIAYCVAEIAGRLKGRRGAAFVAAAFFTVMVSGKLVYVNPLYSLAENSYHVPDSVVHICDAIRVRFPRSCCCMCASIRLMSVCPMAERWSWGCPMSFMRSWRRRTP